MFYDRTPFPYSWPINTLMHFVYYLTKHLQSSDECSSCNHCDRFVPTLELPKNIHIFFKWSAVSTTEIIPFGIGINENKYDMKRKTMHSMPVSICLIFFIYALQSNNNQLRPDRFEKKKLYGKIKNNKIVVIVQKLRPNGY